jgi:hypothetical protein
MGGGGVARLRVGSWLLIAGSWQLAVGGDGGWTLMMMEGRG